MTSPLEAGRLRAGTPGTTAMPVTTGTPVTVHPAMSRIPGVAAVMPGVAIQSLLPRNRRVTAGRTATRAVAAPAGQTISNLAGRRSASSRAGRRTPSRQAAGRKTISNTAGLATTRPQEGQVIRAGMQLAKRPGQMKAVQATRSKRCRRPRKCITTGRQDRAALAAAGRHLARTRRGRPGEALALQPGYFRRDCPGGAGRNLRRRWRHPPGCRYRSAGPDGPRRCLGSHPALRCARIGNADRCLGSDGRDACFVGLRPRCDHQAGAGR